MKTNDVIFYDSEGAEVCRIDTNGKVTGNLNAAIEIMETQMRSARYDRNAIFVILGLMRAIKTGGKGVDANPQPLPNGLSFTDPMSGRKITVPPAEPTPQTWRDREPLL